MTTLPLSGVRFHLSGAVPSENHQHEGAIKEFVTTLVSEVLREGGTILHGSHPSLTNTVLAAARTFIDAGGSQESVVLVRTPEYAETNEQKAEMEQQREYALVHIIPNGADSTEPLVEMRTWMAERSDVVVSIGGKWWEENKPRAGIPKELEASLKIGKPGFVCAGFGGAAAGYLTDSPETLRRLKNGLSLDENKDLSWSEEPVRVAHRVVEQAKLLPLVKQRTVSNRLHRILSLDGGGLRGAFTAAVLAKWADMLARDTGETLIDHFDLVGGTSTGSILGIGLGLGMTPREVLEFYRDDGPKIFKSGHWKGSKYDSEKLRETLTRILSDRKLAESKCRLVIPTVNALHGKAAVIVTPHHPDRAAYRDISAVDAAMASAAAPTYFDEAYVDDGLAKTPYLDGGIWANNPVLAAVAEGTGPLGWAMDRIDVLSIGTLTSESNFEDALGGGKLTWAMSISDLFFAAQESAASMVADQLLTQSRHLRINQSTPTEIGLDNADALNRMIQRGTEVGAATFASVRSRFLDGHHASNWRTN